jgi:DNA polymerase-3 subunit alpha
VKSKAAKAAHHQGKPVQIAPPPANVSMDDAMDLYQAEAKQYS